MSQQLKDNERYGLGSAIGYKGCHLFAKGPVHIRQTSYITIYIRYHYAKGKRYYKEIKNL